MDIVDLYPSSDLTKENIFYLIAASYRVITELADVNSTIASKRKIYHNRHAAEVYRNPQLLPFVDRSEPLQYRYQLSFRATALVSGPRANVVLCPTPPRAGSDHFTTAQAKGATSMPQFSGSRSAPIVLMR